MSRIQAGGVYSHDAPRAAENQGLGAVHEVAEVSADVAPFASEWLKRLQTMTEPNEFSKLVAPKWPDPSAPPTHAEVRQSLTTAFQKIDAREGGPIEDRMSKTIERYLRLNLEMTHRIG